MSKVNDYTMDTQIHVYRAMKRMTQQELANQVGVSRQTIMQLEKNKFNPSLKLAYAISEILGGEIKELFLLEAKEAKEVE